MKRNKIQEPEPILYNTMALTNSEEEVEYTGDYPKSEVNRIKAGIGKDFIVGFKNGSVNLKFFYEVMFKNKEPEVEEE